MKHAIKYECKECEIAVQVAIWAPPRDSVAAVQKFQNFFYKCPRCGQELPKLVANSVTGQWVKAEEE